MPFSTNWPLTTSGLHRLFHPRQFGRKSRVAVLLGLQSELLESEGGDKIKKGKCKHRFKQWETIDIKDTYMILTIAAIALKN